MGVDFYTPIITPFKEDESIDYDALYSTCQKHMQNGAEGIYSGGSSAEFPLLNDEERRRTLEIVTEAVKPFKGKVIAHIGSPSIRQACELAEHASKCGVDGISSVAPYYFTYDFDEIKNYYNTIADNSGLEMMIYNVPSMTGNKLSAKEICELAEYPNITSLKYTDNDTFMLERINAIANIRVYSGKDECFLSMLATGADGAIGTTFNFMLNKFKKIKSKYHNGDIGGALREQNSVNNIITAIVSSKIIPAVKYLMMLQGFPVRENCRGPIRALNMAEKDALKKVFEEELLGVEDSQYKII